MPSKIMRMLQIMGASFGSSDSSTAPAMSSPDDLGLALHYAAVHGNKKRLKKILKTGIAVDYPNDSGQTALFCACYEGQEQIVKILLANGADPNVKSCDGLTAVHAAAFSCNIDILAAVIEHGGDLRLHDNEGRTPKVWATYQHNAKKREEMLEFLTKIKSLAMTSSGRNLAEEKQSKEFFDQLKLEGSNSLMRMFRRVRTLNSTAVNQKPPIQGIGFGKVYMRGREDAGCFAPIPIIPESTLRHDRRGVTYPNGPFMVNESVRWERISVTAKRLHKNQVEGGLVDLLINEHSNMAGLRHPNILLLMGICRTDDMDGLILVFERVGLGNLNRYLHHTEGSMTLDQMCSVMRQVCDAVMYLHQRRLVHCWITSHAVHLVSTTVSKLGNMEYMIDNSGCDGKSPRSDVVNNMHTDAAYNWMAPEVMDGETPTEVSDVYSLCAVIWECVYGQIPWKSLAPESIKQEMLTYYKTLVLDKKLHRSLHGLLNIGLKSADTVRSTVSVDEIKDTLGRVFQDCLREPKVHKGPSPGNESNTSAESDSCLEGSPADRNKPQQVTPRRAGARKTAPKGQASSKAGPSKAGPSGRKTSGESSPQDSTLTPTLKRNIGGAKIFKIQRILSPAHKKRPAPTPEHTPVQKDPPEQAEDEEEESEESTEEEIEISEFQLSKEDEMALKQLLQEEKLKAAREQELRKWNEQQQAERAHKHEEKLWKVREQELQVERMAHEQVQLVMEQVAKEQELAKEQDRRNRQAGLNNSGPGNPFKQLSTAEEQEVNNIAKAASSKTSLQQLPSGPSLAEGPGTGLVPHKIKTGSEIIEAARSSTTTSNRGYQHLSTTNKTIGLYAKQNTYSDMKSTQSSTVYKVLSQPLATLHSQSARQGKRVSAVQQTYLSQVASDGHADTTTTCQSAVSLSTAASSTNRLPVEPEAPHSPGNFKPASHRKSMDTGESPSKLRAECSVLVSPVPPQTGSLHQLYPPRVGSAVRRSLQTNSSPAGLANASTLPRNFRSPTAKGSPGLPTSWDNYRSERYDQLVSSARPRDHSKTSPPRISPRESIGTWFGGGAANIQALISEFQQKWCNHEQKQSVLSLKQKPQDFQGCGKVSRVNCTGDVSSTTKSWVKNSDQVMTSTEGLENDELRPNEGRESLNSNNNATDVRQNQADVEEFYFDDEIGSDTSQARHLRLQTLDVSSGATTLRSDRNQFSKVPSMSLPATPSCTTAGNSTTATPNVFYFDDTLRSASTQAGHLRLQTPDVTQGTAVDLDQNVAKDDLLSVSDTPSFNTTPTEEHAYTTTDGVPGEEPDSKVNILPLRRESLQIAHISQDEHHGHSEMEACQEEEEQQEARYGDTDEEHVDECVDNDQLEGGYSYEEQAREYTDEDQVEGGYSDKERAEKYVDKEQVEDVNDVQLSEADYVKDAQPEDEQLEYSEDEQTDGEEVGEEQQIEYLNEDQVETVGDAPQSGIYKKMYEEQEEELSGSEYSDAEDVAYSGEDVPQTSFEVQL